MSKLEELIQELCPNGVEYKKLGEIAEIGTGSSNGNEAIENGNYPFFIRSKTIKYKNSYEFNEEAIIIPGEGGIGEIFHYINGKYALHQRVYRLHFFINNINVKFIYYFMVSNFKRFILKKALNATVTSIRKPMIANFLIPLPPLEVQKEIVRILDNYTKFTEELKENLAKELILRKKQYEYYREKLFTFDDNVEWVTLGDIGTFIRGNGLQKKDFVTTGYPCIHYGQIYKYFNTSVTNNLTCINKELYNKLKKASFGDLIIAITSENIEDVCKSIVWLGNTDIAIGGHSTIYKHSQQPKFIAYYFQTNFFQVQKKTIVTGTKVIEVSPSKLSKIKIPLPSLEEQERIVKILDKFDALCNDLSIGLPAEIEKRQKQYEYYREKLLTFKEKQ